MRVLQEFYILLQLIKFKLKWRLCHPRKRQNAASLESFFRSTVTNRTVTRRTRKYCRPIFILSGKILFLKNISFSNNLKEISLLKINFFDFF